MKIVIMVAGGSKYFPLFIDKPKTLYHLNGEIQLERVINDAKAFVAEKDIIVVAGYKYKYIQTFLEKYPEIELRINNKYKEAAINSFRTAITGIDDDVLFMFGDESISQENISRIINSSNKMAILYHDMYYYYSLGIFKLRKDQLYLFNDDKYDNLEAIKEIYCFANQKDQFDGQFDINSGICIGYIIIDLIRRIGGIKKITLPDGGSDAGIDFLYYDPRKEYKGDLDYFEDTDEYKDILWIRLYYKYFTKPIRKVMRLMNRLKNKVCGL